MSSLSELLGFFFGQFIDHKRKNQKKNRRSGGRRFVAGTFSMWTLTQKFRLEFVARSLAKIERERKNETSWKITQLLSVCRREGEGNVKNKLQIWLQVGIQLGPGPGHSVILSNCSCSVCMQKESLSFCAHGQEKLVSFARRERDSHWANESISRVGYTLLPRSPSRSRSRRMFLLRFFTRLSAPLRKCLSTSLPQSRCCPMLPSLPPPPLPLAVFCSSSECVELARGKAYIYMNKVE